jgi:cobalt-zinc-cadmium efflux system outer membrane protein
MKAFGKRIVLCLIGGLLGGCAAQHYKASPIVPSTTATQFESRSLADAGLRSFEEKNLGHPVSPWPAQKWDLQSLSLAALYFNPSLDLARARAVTAEGAVETAGARPNPTLDLVPGVPSPYLLTQDVLFLIETAGKRGHRVEAAKKLDQAAQFDLADSAWTVAMGVRTALLNYLVASRNLELFESQGKARQDQVAILEQILAAGEMTRFNVDFARIDLSKTTVAARAAEVQLADAKSALAGAIGVPTTALNGAEFSWSGLAPGLDTLPAPESISVEKVRREAVVNRLDIRRSLAQYEAAEADLRSEIAKQYPNFNIGPGYTYEERNSFFTVGFSTSLPVFNRNKGPIEEAKGRREQAAAAFRQTQAQAIEKSERALAVYTAAVKEAAEAQSLYQLQEAQVRVVQQSIGAGADYRLNLDGAQIQALVLAQARLDALARAQQAFGDLEDSLQQPLAPGEMLPIAPESSSWKEISGERSR